MAVEGQKNYDYIKRIFLHIYVRMKCIYINKEMDT
jgi:hypothetical protein